MGLGKNVSLGETKNFFCIFRMFVGRRGQALREGWCLYFTAEPCMLVLSGYMGRGDRDLAFILRT